MAVPPVRPQTMLEFPDDLKPTYANLVRITHSPADLVLDFSHLIPGEGKARVGARIVMSPVSAKLLFKALGDNLAHFEATFGEILLPRASLAEHLFRPFQQPQEGENTPEEGTT